jgi:hypothetical protein
MNESGDKVLRVNGVDYIIDESAEDTDAAAVVGQIEQALAEGTLVKVPVLDAKSNRMTLYLNGRQVDTVVLDLGEGDRPGEISPR